MKLETEAESNLNHPKGRAAPLWVWTSGRNQDDSDIRGPKFWELLVEQIKNASDKTMRKK